MKGQPFCSSPLTLWLNAAAGPATAPMFPRLPPASLTPGASVSQISQGSILVLASAGHPHCQLDATRPDMKLILVNSADAYGSSLFLFFPTLHPSSLPDSTWPVDLRFHPKCEE